MHQRAERLQGLEPVPLDSTGAPETTDRGGDTQGMALRGQKWGGDADFGVTSCIYRSAELSGSQEGVLGQCQRAWLPGVQKETSPVPGCRSQASDCGTK